MNRKQKIIVSTTGIFLVLLILVGLTYAYFLTRINGNTNDKSISVSTANLELKYNDIEQVLISEENVEPGTTWTKKFSATNTGSKKVESYAVVLENVINTLERTEDLVYTLNCISSLGTNCNKVEAEQEFPVVGKILITNSIESKEVQSYELTITYKEQNIDQSVDMNKQFSAKVNLANPSTFGALGSGTLASAIIENGANIRTITGEFDTSVSCGNDLNSCLLANEYGCPASCYKDGTKKEEVKNTKTIKKTNSTNELSKHNFMSMSDGTSWNNDTNDFTNDGIFINEDDYGMSYYFRGPIINNYINFAGKCWRIVRISGDGSIKLILEDQKNTCENSTDVNWNISTIMGGTTTTGNFGYTSTVIDKVQVGPESYRDYTLYKMDYLNGDSSSMGSAFKNFQETFTSKELSYLKNGDWCLNDKAYTGYYGKATEISSEEASTRQNSKQTFSYTTSVNKPTFKCNGTNLMKFSDNTNMYVGTLTSDEIYYAGALYGSYNPYYYLKTVKLEQLTLSPNNFYSETVESTDVIYIVDKYGRIMSSGRIDYSYSFRPAINLKSGIKIITGDGTKENPYVVE